MSRLHLNATESSLVDALADAEVEFIIVGGHAVVFHGHKRAIADLDIFCRPSIENAAHIRRVLLTYGIELDDDCEAGLATPGKQLPFSIYGSKLDILTSLEDVPWDAALRQAERCIGGDRPAPVLSKEHLIKSKLRLRDSKHSDDISALRAL